VLCPAFGRAGDAVTAIDAALSDLHEVRARLASEIRASDDASAARADALLRVNKLPARHDDGPDQSQP
jgi:hypothetical protein